MLAASPIRDLVVALLEKAAKERGDAYARLYYASRITGKKEDPAEAKHADERGRAFGKIEQSLEDMLHRIDEAAILRSMPAKMGFYDGGPERYRREYYQEVRNARR